MDRMKSTASMNDSKIKVIVRLGGGMCSNNNAAVLLDDGVAFISVNERVVYLLLS